MVGKPVSFANHGNHKNLSQSQSRNACVGIWLVFLILQGINSKSCDNPDLRFYTNKSIVVVFYDKPGDSSRFYTFIEFVHGLTQRLPQAFYSLALFGNGGLSLAFREIPAKDLQKDMWQGRPSIKTSFADLRYLEHDTAVMLGINLPRPLESLTTMCKRVYDSRDIAELNKTRLCYQVYLEKSISSYKDFYERAFSTTGHVVNFKKSYESLNEFVLNFQLIYNEIICALGAFIISVDVFKCRRNIVHAVYRGSQKNSLDLELWTVRLNKLWVLYYKNGSDATPSDKQSWLDAKKLCSKGGMKLLTARNQSELDYLVYKVPCLLKAVRRYVSHAGNSFLIPMDLSRNRGSIGRRFQWQEKNDLKFSFWGRGEPQKPFKRNCGGWQWEYPTSQNFHPVDGKPLYRDDIWKSSLKSVACGEKSISVAICLKDAELIEEGLQYIPETEIDDKLILGNGAVKQFFENSDLPVVYSIITQDRFHCRNSTFRLKTISWSKVCDGKVDCASGNDESTIICGVHGPGICSGFEWTCSSRQCIPAEARCDLVQDCEDGSDEENCESCAHRMCSSGYCLPKSWFCDGFIDCDDASDEHDCAGGTEECVFLCNRTQCVTRQMINDSVIDCKGPEGPLDETIGALEAMNCTRLLKNINIWAPVCILVRDSFGEIIGCRDFEHLTHCDNFTCPQGYVKCPESFCIPLALVNDGREDCQYGEDEGKNIIKAPNKVFRCRQDKEQYVPLSAVCDGRQDCSGGEDEENCGLPCPGQLVCNSGLIRWNLLEEPGTLSDFNFITHQIRILVLSFIDVHDFFNNFPRGHLNHLIILNLTESNIESIAYQPSNSNHDMADCGGYEKENDFQRVQRLDLARNKLKVLPTCSFLRRMLSLKYLNLARNRKLSIVLKHSFSGLNELLDLDLSYTAIRYLNAEIFEDLDNLKSLELSGTGITILDMKLPQTLQEIILADTNIKHIEKHVFARVERIKYIVTPNYKLCCPQVLRAKPSMYYCSLKVINACNDLVEELWLRAPLWLMSMSIIAGNGVTLAYRLGWDTQLLHKPHGFFVTNLCLSDLLMGVYLMHIAVADAIFQGEYVFHDYRWRNSYACWAAGVLSTVSCINSSIFLALITIDRYLAVRYPYGDVRFTHTAMRATVLAVWLFGFAIATVPMLPFAHDWTIFSKNGMCHGLSLQGGETQGWFFSSFIFIGLNFVLFCFIGGGQAVIFRTIREKGKRSKRHSTNPNSQLRQNQRMQEFAIAKQLAVVVVTNFLCLFPVITMGVMAMAGYDIGQTVYRLTAVVILPVNPAINPLLYTLPAIRSKWSDYRAEKTLTKLATLRAARRRRRQQIVGNDKCDKAKVMIRCYKNAIILKHMMKVKAKRKATIKADTDKLLRVTNKCSNTIKNFANTHM